MNNNKWEQTIRHFSDQDFESIRKKCREQSRLFEDPIFPARFESLAENYRQSIVQWRQIVWKRPFEIVENAQFVVNGIKRTDPNQGDLGNCWFIAAMTALTQNEMVLRRIVPSGQSFRSDWYGESKRPLRLIVSWNISFSFLALSTMVRRCC